MNIEDKVRQHINDNGLTGVINQVNSLINNANLSTVERKIISVPALYATCLDYAFFVENVNNTDVNGIYQACMRSLQKLVQDFYRELIDEVLTLRGISLPADTDLAEQITEMMLSVVMQSNVPVSNGEAADIIVAIYYKVKELGPINYFVRQYIAISGDVDPNQFNDKIINAMVDYMSSMKLSIPQTISGLDAAISNHSFDEYFALALDYALRVESGGVDPIDLYRIKGSQNTWDFSVDLFESSAKQGIVPRNILGAGALYYTYVLGEQLQCFNLAEALILKWARGNVYVSDPATEGKLYRFYKLLEERANNDERGMLFKRVLNLSDANLLEGTIVNESFSRLWSELMHQIVEYITKTETSNNRDFVSRLPITQLIREIQYNLTSFFTGMAHVQATEMYNHLQDAMEILSDDGIINQIAPGRSKNVWSVIDALHKETYGSAPNITAYKTAAVEGYKLFQYVSNFSDAAFDNNQFIGFIQSAESYIIALSQEGSTTNNGEISRGELAAVEEEFEDWDN